MDIPYWVDKYKKAYLLSLLQSKEQILSPLLSNDQKSKCFADDTSFQISIDEFERFVLNNINNQRYVEFFNNCCEQPTSPNIRLLITTCNSQHKLQDVSHFETIKYRIMVFFNEYASASIMRSILKLTTCSICFGNITDFNNVNARVVMCKKCAKLCIGYEVMIINWGFSMFPPSVYCYWNDNVNLSNCDYLVNCKVLESTVINMKYTPDINKICNHIMNNFDKIIHSYFNVNFDAISIFIMGTVDERILGCPRDVIWYIIKFVYTNSQRLT